MAKKNDKPKRDTELPEGFEELGQTRVAGWFVLEAGNSVQGFIKDTFETTNRFDKKNKKRVYKVELSDGTTKIVNSEGEIVEARQGDLIGLDEKGYLKKLADLEKGREFFALCKGKEDEEDEKSPWIFKLGAVPF